MTKHIILSSGNSAWYTPGQGRVVSLLMITSPLPGNKFLGGAAGEEADRKFRIFSTFPNVRVNEVVGMPIFGSLDTSTFNEWVGSASGLMEEAERAIGDNDVSSYGRGVACEERRSYYYAVGLARMYDSNLVAPLWSIIANHVSVFSREHFRETFFRGDDLVSCRGDVRVRGNLASTRYSERGFKAPAYYLRESLRQRRGISRGRY